MSYAISCLAQTTLLSEVGSFDRRNRGFSCADVTYLDTTFKSVCERINMFMKREHDGKRAVMIFDNRDHTTDHRNALAITNYFNKSLKGKSMRTSILEVPVFAISQAGNVGLQVADVVTTIIGLYAKGEPRIDHLWGLVKKRLYSWKDNYGRKMSTLRWLDPENVSRAKK